MQLILDRFPVATFSRGSLIISKGRSPGQLGYLHEGIVKNQGNMTVRKRRSSVTLDIYGPGNWIGTESLRIDRNLFAYTALAPCRVTLIESKSLSETDLQLPWELCAQVAEGYLNLAGRQALRREPLQIRILYLYSSIYEKCGSIDVPLTQGDIADLTGSDQAHVSEALRELTAKGLFTRRQRAYVPVNPEELRDAALQLSM